MKKAQILLPAISGMFLLACEQVSTNTPNFEENDLSRDFSCLTESLAENSGIKIICNGDSIGYVLNGVDSKDGSSSNVKVKEIEATEEHPNGGILMITTNTDAEGNSTADTVYVWNGANGTNGEKGEKGDKGDQGEQGPQGEPGKDYTPSSSSEPSRSNSESSSSAEASSSSVSSSSVEEELSDACKTMRATQDTFIPLENVFNCVRSSEKVVFVIRHAERDHDDHSPTGDLNSYGYSQTAYLGKKLVSQQYNFNYMSTSVYRTMRTNIEISRNKGENLLNWDDVKGGYAPNYIISEDFKESWFHKVDSPKDCANITSWARYTKFAYDTTACRDKFYNVDEKTKEIIDKHFMYNAIGKTTMVISHDQFVAPFLISVTDRKINLRAYEYVRNNGYDNDWNFGVFNHWPNYLSGAAIIINGNNERTFIPVKGLKTGFLGEHCPNNEHEDHLYTCNKWY